LIEEGRMTKDTPTAVSQQAAQQKLWEQKLCRFVINHSSNCSQPECASHKYWNAWLQSGLE
jgi:hypothetical protein